MTDKQIIIDGVNVKDCKRRIGKDNFCRYYKRPCAENNYNCIWKKYLRKEQECEELKEIINGLLKIQYQLADSCKKYIQTLTEIKEIARGVRNYLDCPSPRDVRYEMDIILQKISECEAENEN